MDNKQAVNIERFTTDCVLCSMQIGRYYELEVAKEVPFGVYLNSDLGEILLPSKYIPEGLEVGDDIEVFLHRDSEDRLLATTLQPKGILDEFVALEVKGINEHGAFMDWGLEKDLFVPRREQHVPFQEGQTYVVRICLDHKTDRLLGVGKINAFLRDAGGDYAEGETVDLLVYDQTDLGYMAIINGEQKGLIYENEIFDTVHIGQQRKGYIKTIREDGKIDLTLYPVGKEAIDVNSTTVLDRLKANGGYLPFHDKSTSEDIVMTFNMSKKAFKKAVGSLYKQQLITLEAAGIRLK